MYKAREGENIVRTHVILQIGDSSAISALLFTRSMFFRFRRVKVFQNETRNEWIDNIDIHTKVTTWQFFTLCSLTLWSLELEQLSGSFSHSSPCHLFRRSEQFEGIPNGSMLSPPLIVHFDSIQNVAYLLLFLNGERTDLTLKSHCLVHTLGLSPLTFTLLKFDCKKWPHEKWTHALLTVDRS